jgi:SRSO17 transposase
LPTLIWLSGLRWAIEQCFEETKTELGMDQYEVQKFPEKIGTLPGFSL